MRMDLRRRALIAAQKEYYIPPEYAEIESLEFTGLQWFDTGIYFNEKTRLEVDFTPTRLPASSEYPFVIGAYDGTYNCGIDYLAPDNYSIYYNYGARGGTTYQAIFSGLYSDGLMARQIMAVNGRVATLNSQTITVQAAHSFTCGRTAYIGNTNRASGSYPAFIRGRKFIIWDDGVNLSRFYVPVRRKTDDLGGYYDVINQTFNPSMTNTPFVKGADV